MHKHLKSSVGTDRKLCELHGDQLSRKHYGGWLDSHSYSRTASHSDAKDHGGLVG